MKYWYVIPARSGSKGLPGKNRILFDHTASKIPKRVSKSVIVTTDDSEVATKAEEKGFLVQNRSAKNSSDTASTRDVLLEVINEFKIPEDDKVVLLYLTYPSRKWRDVLRAKKILEESKSTSLLCRKEIENTPYLMFFDMPESRGEKVIDHDLCRRQDYRKCFEVSHYVGIFDANVVPELDTNLWKHDTIFMKISDKVDVDYKEDLDTFLVGEKNDS